MAKAYIETYGCQANIADSEAIAGVLKNSGYEITGKLEDSDVVVLNTCAVKNATQSSIFNFIDKFPKDKKLVVGGCLTKVIDIKKKFKNVHAVFDTNSIMKAADSIENNNDHFSDERENRINLPVVRKDNDTGIIFIEQGCTNFCTFCATKIARGNLKSYRIGDVKRSVEDAVKNGCKKIYLTGQDTGAYGLDIKSDLPALLKELLTIDGKFIIRVGMMNPWHTKRILENLIDVYRNDKIMKFLHIPVQSGSDIILKKMKRNHSIDDFKNIVKIFREEFPDITISTDVIVGYPEESENDFYDTVNLIKEIKPEVLNVSRFSSRPGTYASKLKQLSTEIIDKRSVYIVKLHKELIQ